MHLKQLLSTRELSRVDLQEILDSARKFVSPTGLSRATYDFLEGKRFVLAFFEPSTRTRVSFEMAIHRAGGWSAQFQSIGSSVEKGETLDETLRTLLAMDFDGLIIRHGENGVMNTVREFSPIPIINAGEGTISHPTQALLDASTLLERFGSLDGRTICIVGDIRHSRVARSNLDVFTKMGASVSYCCPDEFAPDDVATENLVRFNTIAEAMKHCEIVNMLRIQRERIASDVTVALQNYRDKYGLTSSLVNKYPNVSIIHPGPVNVGVEIDAEVLNSSSCLIHRQVTHGVAVRMAVLQSVFSNQS
jgi:aspartate carbamoyltransferase catalytic subunit